MSRLPSETGKVSGFRLGWAPPFVWAAASRWEGSNAGSVVPVVHDANFSWWPDAKVFTCALLHDSRFHFLSIEQVLLYSMNSLCSDIGQLEFGEEFSSDEENNCRLEFLHKVLIKRICFKGETLRKTFDFKNGKSTIVTSSSNTTRQLKIGVCHSKGEKYLLLSCLLRKIALFFP